MGEDGFDAGHGQRGGGVNGKDPGGGVRGAQDLQVQQPGQLGSGNVHGVAGPAGDDVRSGGGRYAGADGGRGAGVRRALRGRSGVRSGIGPGIRSGGFRCGPGSIRLHGAVSADRVPDGAVARATAKVALQVPRQVLLLFLVERRGGHHHARRAEPALESLRVQELLLHRMQLTAVGQALDGGDVAAFRAGCRVEAAVHRTPVHVHRAGSAVPGVAALLHAQGALFAQEGAQALARERCSVNVGAVDPVGHGNPSFGGGAAAADGPASGTAGAAGAASSARTCSASRSVM